MVETFVNFRPKELWPKRVLKFADASGRAEQVLRRSRTKATSKANER